MEETKKQKRDRKTKISDDKPDRWSDEETEKLLDYLEENFDKFRQGKKSEFYTLVSRDIIRSKFAKSIKG